MTKEYTITYGFQSDSGQYTTSKSKPIPAASANEAAIMLKDQFESFEGLPCDIISISPEE